MQVNNKIWFVIEGDNGSGKDTLADRFETKGWHIVSRERHLMEACARARSYNGSDFMKAFMEYNRLCAEAVAESERRAVLVRYWPSTINGAFADGIISAEQHQTLLKQCLTDYLTPNAFVYLTCDLTERCKRVQGRGTVDAVDDMSDLRNSLYRSSTVLCSQLIPNWRFVSSQQTPDEVYSEVTNLFNEGDQ